MANPEKLIVIKMIPKEDKTDLIIETKNSVRDTVISGVVVTLFQGANQVLQGVTQGIPLRFDNIPNGSEYRIKAVHPAYKDYEEVFTI